MIAIIIDDDINATKLLQSALCEFSIITEIYSFSSCSRAMEWMKEHVPDIVLMECVVENSSTITVARTILKQYPGCKVIFCTAYSYFALDAFQIHASGYLLKPITAERLLAEVAYVCGSTSKKMICAKCFGEFEVKAHGQMLTFKRNKTKELLALLIDNKGEGLTAKQICTYLWASDEHKNINYLYQLFDDLRNVLRKLNAEQVLVKTGSKYAIAPQEIECDYYSYLESGSPTFHGEYMQQYCWAEETRNYLTNV